MKKYLHIAKMSFGQTMQYRLNFVFGRLRNFMVVLLFLFIWMKLTETGKFAGYAREEVMTYLFMMIILRGIIFGGQSRVMAEEINNGWFSKYLTQPISHFWYQFWRESGERLINFLSAIFEVVIFSLLFNFGFIWQSSVAQLAWFGLSLTLALIIYYLLSYALNMLAFWSREAFGPRFLFEWLLEYSSGAIFPLDIVKTGVYNLLGRLPFFYIIFFPISIYLGRFTGEMITHGLFLQSLWIGILGMLCWMLWGEGLKRYSGEGI